MQPCLVAAALQFQRTLAKPPPAGNVAELKVHAHRSAHSYPDAVYLGITVMLMHILIRKAAKRSKTGQHSAYARDLIQESGFQAEPRVSRMQSMPVECQAHPTASGAGHKTYQALMRGSVALSLSSWATMEAMPSASAL